MPAPRLTYAEAAEYLKVSERTLRSEVSCGRLKGYHVGRRKEFTTEALDAWLASRATS